MRWINFPRIVALSLTIIQIVTVEATVTQNKAAPHPLDPLTGEEIILTVSIVKKHRWEKSTIFNHITLKEPPKALLLPHFLQDTIPPPGSIPRKALVILYNRLSKRTHEVIVNLNQQQVEKWEGAPEGVNFGNTPDELVQAEGIVMNDSGVVERCRRLGWTDMRLVHASAWPMFYVGDKPEYRGKRLLQLFVNGQNYPDDNGNAHPFDFLPIVDIDERRVIAIEDLPTQSDIEETERANCTVPSATSHYRTTPKGDPFPYREGLKPINISQPNGTSFSINGHEVTWQKFKFRVGFSGREGLMLHHVKYMDGSTMRPLFYRMSVSELFVPYGDPRPPYHRKTAFDEGEDGLGLNALPLEAQLDCLGEVHMFDYVLNNEMGGTVKFPRAVCMSEEDTGILWKHTDYRTGRNVVVRSQRLTLQFTVTYNNYDYMLAWHLYQDGSIEFSAKLTGLLTTNLSADKHKAAPYGSTVFPQIYAQYHQHYFTLRLDPEIDGGGNTVTVVDVVPLDAPTGSKENPYGQGFTTNVTVLKTVGQARTDADPEKSRTWHIRNDHKLNSYTRGPVAWKLVPFPSPHLMMKEDSPMKARVGFMDYDVWVTPHDDEEMYPVGLYANGSGLPEWVGRDLNRNLENEDVVLWHTVGISHIPRTEDFPSMPAE